VLSANNTEKNAVADLYAYDPFGVNHLKGADRQPITQAYQGDGLFLLFPGVTINDAPAIPGNSIVEFRLKNDRFDSNVPEVNPVGTPPPPEPSVPPPWVLPRSDPFDQYLGPQPSGLIWVGTWKYGIEVTSTPGQLKVTLPQWVMDLLRRGAYIYSLDIAEPKLRERRQTLAEGTIQIEYGANAPHPDVPYRESAYRYNFILGRLS
jgi:hypothetical protein